MRCGSCGHNVNECTCWDSKEEDNDRQNTK